MRFSRYLLGSTSPVLYIKDDKKYVFKYSSKKFELLNEWMAYKIAQSIGLPVPSMCWTQIELDTKIFTGLSIDYIDHIDFVQLCTDQNVPLWNFFSRLKNVELLSRLLCFDLLINNQDRSSNLGNLLVKSSDDEFNFVAIDHGASFGIGDLPDLSLPMQLNFSSTRHPFPFNHVYDIIKFNIHFNSSFDKTFEKDLDCISRINKQTLEYFIEEIPSMYKSTIDHTTQTYYIEFLLNRKQQLLPYLKYLYERNWFPNRCSFDS